jgi:hypothetical protein
MKRIIKNAEFYMLRRIYMYIIATALKSVDIMEGVVAAVTKAVNKAAIAEDCSRNDK